MKVLHVQKATGIGGSERHLLALLPSLRSRGIEVRMCVPGAGESYRFVDALKERHLDVDVVRAGPHVNPVLLPEVARIIRGYQPDLIHTHLIHGDLHGQLAARFKGVRGISSFHSTAGFYRRQPFLSAARLAGHLAARTIAISHHVGRFLTNNLIAPPDSIRIVPYGIDVSGWSLSEERRQKNRHRLGLPGERVVVGVASRLVENKGHEWLPQAIRMALADAPDLYLLIAGEGPLAAKLQHRAAALPPGHTRFLGFIADMREFMNACDILVFPSLPGFGEGFDLAALEAMAAGRPVLASDLDSLPEVVEHGKTGFLVSPGDAHLLADKLGKLAKDHQLRRTLGAQGRRRALTKFSLNSMVNKTVSVYREVT